MARSRTARSRKARPSDIGELALALPETAEAIVWGERLTDVVVFSCSTPEEKAGLLKSGPPRFATPHFDGYSSVLVRPSGLGKVTLDELAEVVEDAWLARAPKRLATEWLAAQD